MHAAPTPAPGRFIPTRMGNTVCRIGVEPVYAVHPHTHGEHNIIEEKFLSEIGSSPHAWGTQGSGEPGLDDQRFIPTRMGNTHGKPDSEGERTVHPHTHGEHKELRVDECCWFGSSPHAWGTLPICGVSIARGRFIPTRMGNTQDALPLSVEEAVHPHTHGEHRTRGSIPIAASGSSPHAWGTQRRSPTQRSGWRFIPTRMGNTVRPPVTL